MKQIATLFLSLLVCQSVAAQTSFSFEDIVISRSPSGEVIQVGLANGRTVLCGDNLLKVCSSVFNGDTIALRGKLPTSDSDAGSLGAFVAEFASVDSPTPPFDDAWSIDGCIASKGTNGASVQFTLERGQVSQTVLCGPSGALGHVCLNLSVGDCAVFSGDFPQLGDENFSLGVLNLRRLSVGSQIFADSFESGDSDGWQGGAP